MPLIRLAGDNFPRNLLWANLAYLWNAGGNTCCAMASHGRRIIDTSIVSQSRVLLIRCPCKSVPPTANQGKTNTFLIKSSLTTCLYCAVLLCNVEFRWKITLLFVYMLNLWLHMQNPHYRSYRAGTRNMMLTFDSRRIYRALTYIAIPLLGPEQPRYIGLTL